MKTCSVDGCKNKTFSRALQCPTHIHRRKHGIPLTLPIKYLKHGHVGTLTYRSWAMMKNRCTNPRAQDWRYYGRRGITLCKRWHDFQNFLKDMGERSAIELTLDRKNNERGYSKSNCRWATKIEQRANQRRP